jgi:cytidylate kinase
MPVITVSRQYASGGSNIARLVAERLGWTLVDNEFVGRVARQAGLSRQEVEEREERVPGLAERLARALAISSPEVFVATGEPPEPQFGSEADLVRATEAVINQAVQQDERLIMVGRGAQAHLAQHEDSLHVYVVAPREQRIRAAADRLGMSVEEAGDCVDKTDEGRRRYVKANYHRQWEDATNYHLVLNTAVFSYEQCADLIVEAARTRGWA